MVLQHHGAGREPGFQNAPCGFGVLVNNGSVWNNIKNMFKAIPLRVPQGKTQAGQGLAAAGWDSQAEKSRGVIGTGQAMIGYVTAQGVHFCHPVFGSKFLLQSGPQYRPVRARLGDIRGLLFGEFEAGAVDAIGIHKTAQ